MIGSYPALVLIAVALAGCGRDGSAAALNEPIQLAPGQSAVFKAEKLEVKFVDIASDSRCPSDVTCVWAGEVVVRLTVRHDSRSQEVGIKDAQSLDVGGYTVSVLEVLPTRTTSQPIAPADYRVTLKVARPTSQ